MSQSNNSETAFSMHSGKTYNLLLDADEEKPVELFISHDSLSAPSISDCSLQITIPQNATLRHREAGIEEEGAEFTVPLPTVFGADGLEATDGSKTVEFSIELDGVEEGEVARFELLVDGTSVDQTSVPFHP